MPVNSLKNFVFLRLLVSRISVLAHQKAASLQRDARLFLGKSLPNRGFTRARICSPKATLKPAWQSPETLSPVAGLGMNVSTSAR